jgi:flagellar basal-body rod protein FlgF
MSDVFEIASIGMLEGRQRLEAISVNAASASLPGFRRHVVTGTSFDATLAALDAATDATAEVAQPQVDLRPGAMIATGRALDMAIEGDELFFALTDGANTWLTRAGSFRVGEDGVLIGERGLRVVGANGDVRLPGSDVQVSPDGRITHDGTIVAALQLFRPNDPASLRADGGALLVTSAGVHPADATSGRVRSGSLEASNTDSAREMLTLLALSRQFEALSRVVQGYDEMVGRTIQKLGE